MRRCECTVRPPSKRSSRCLPRASTDSSRRPSSACSPDRRWRGCGTSTRTTCPTRGASLRAARRSVCPSGIARQRSETCCEHPVRGIWTPGARRHDGYMPLFTPAASEDAPPTGPTFGLLWHTFSVDEALDRSHGSFSGLTAPEAARRLERDGRNVIVPVPPRSLAVDLARTLLRPAHLLLAALSAGSFANGRHGLAAAFAALTLVTTLARTLADRRTRSSLTALRELAAPVGRAMRDDRLVDLPAAELVVGDVVEIEAGDIVPADCRLLRARSLTVDESPLTGETAFAHKGVAPVERHATLDARSCLAFAGSVVVAGSARGLVVAT